MSSDTIEATCGEMKREISAAVDADALCFVEGRLSFVGGDQNPNFGVMLAAFGEVPDDLLNIFDRKGTVFKRSDRHQRTRQTGLVASTDDGNSSYADTENDRGDSA